MSDEDPEPLIKHTKMTPIPIDQIVVSELGNPREKISREVVTDLVESIRSVGTVLVPILVYEKGNKYVLLDGERRWRAMCKLAEEHPEDPKFKTIPANVIREKISPEENLRLMINIHQSRRDWSTGAQAEALGNLMKLKGFNLEQAFDRRRELIEITGMGRTELDEALDFLSMPKDLRNKCLSGELDEYYLILLGRNLRSCERTFPEFEKKFSREVVVKRVYSKIDRGIIQRARSLNRIARCVRLCIRYNNDQAFFESFDKFLKNPRMTLEEFQQAIEKQVEPGVIEDEFLDICENTLEYLERFSGNYPESSVSILQEIRRVLNDTLPREKDRTEVD